MQPFPHTVLPGETLWSIAAANNFTTDSLAAYNGLSGDTQVYTGETIQIPTSPRPPAALASSATSSSPTSLGDNRDVPTVQPGESLSSVAAANGISPATLAADNGLSSDALLITGEQITVPTSTGTSTSTSTSVEHDRARRHRSQHPSWTSPIYCPSCPGGEAYLASNAAYNWNAMRQASLNTYGIDLYPAGPSRPTARTRSSSTSTTSTSRAPAPWRPCRAPRRTSTAIALDLADPRCAP